MGKRKMLKFRDMWGNRSVFRYIITFSAVAVSIFIAMGGYLYRYYYRTIYQDFLTANRREAEHIRSRHETELQMLNNIALQMSLESDLTHFCLEEEPEKSVKLKDRLYQYKIANQFFDHIFYCYHRDHFLYNQSTSFEIDFLLTKGLVLREEKREELKEALYSGEPGMRILPEQDASGYLQSKYPIPTKAVIYLMPVLPWRVGTMAFTVNEFYYDALLGSGSADKRSSYIIYDGQVIVSRGSLPAGEEQLVAWAKESGGDTIRVESGGKKYLLVCETGQSGACYCTVQAMEVFRGKVMSGQWGILLLLFLCSIPASLLIIGISRSVSMRVRKLNVLLNQDEEDYYSLDSIESGIQLLSQNSRKAAKESEGYRKSDFIRSFVRSDYGEREVYAAAKKAGFSLEGKVFLAVLLGDRGNHNESRLDSLMLAELKQPALAEGYGIRLVNSGQSLFILFGREKEAIEQILQHMFAYGNEYCEDFIMAVSEYHADFGEGARAYLEADTAFDNRFLTDNSEILRFSEVNIPASVRMLPDTLLFSLKNAVRTGDEEAVEKIVREICSQIKKENHSLLAFRILYHDLVHMLLAEFQGDDKNIRDLYNVFTLSQCLNIQDFNDILCEACRLLMTGRKADGIAGNDMADRAVRYMQENFHDPELTMSRLAEYLGISPVTLAVSLKNSTGISPSDYLAGIRLEKAKELLISTKLLVKEVSLAVGYEDDRVFMRRFKKYTGMTPVQYRTGRIE